MFFYNFLQFFVFQVLSSNGDWQWRGKQVRAERLRSIKFLKFEVSYFKIIN